MKPQTFLIILILSGFTSYTLAQKETYTVIKTPFSSPRYHEFSPVYYKNGIVFSSNRKSSLLVDNSDSLGRSMMKINFIDTTGRNEWKKPRLFSKDLTTPFNDGPVTFNRTFDTVYFSRNLIVDRKSGKLPGPKNRLGIYYAVRDSNKWVRIRELRINNSWYNVTTPWLSPDGKRLYFASDKPEGYGGSDLYYCQWKNDYWDNPVNLGPVINTPGNEAYPFVNEAGELFFSSDGHPGFGGKDIFFSMLKDSAWLPPVPLDPPVNSAKDDFGFIADPLMETGYFSSKDNGSTDIYHFTTNFQQIFYSNEQKNNIYCYLFTDTATLGADPARLQYEWDFGDGKKVTGKTVEHFFPGPGKYVVKQNIIDIRTRRIVFEKLVYDLEIKAIEQPFITCPDAALQGEDIDFDALKTYLPGYEIIGYTWDMGDSTRVNESTVRHSYPEPGIYNVKVGLKVKNSASGIIRQSSVTKRIKICNDDKELSAYSAMTKKELSKVPDVYDYDHAFPNVRYSAEKELAKDAVFHVEIMSSGKMINPDNENFRRARQKYNIREIFLKEKGIYSYVVREEFNLMAAYPALMDVLAMGFSDARIKTTILSSPAETELNTLKKVYGSSADLFFERNNERITQAGFTFLEQVSTLMKRYPGVRLAVEIHSDEAGTDWFNQDLSEKRANAMVDYLVVRGINANRLISRGFGRSSPLTTGDSEERRRMNRRVQFQVMH
jgi:outer membrane protein OmpA-like peptidoglycan-associated protein